jgi:hypothetical protein
MFVIQYPFIKREENESDQINCAVRFFSRTFGTSFAFKRDVIKYKNEIH